MASGMDSPVELYRAHQYHSLFKKPPAGMNSKSIHRWDMHRPKPPNPHMMECTDYLLWTLQQQKDPLMEHGRQAVEMLISDTCGYNAIPSQFKKVDINHKNASHALREAGYTHGGHALKPTRRTPAAPSSATSSRAGLEPGLQAPPGYPSPSSPQSRAAASRPRTQGDLRLRDRRPQSARASVGRRDTPWVDGGRRDVARESLDRTVRRTSSSSGGSQARRPDARQQTERQDTQVRAKSARAQSSRYTQTSFSDRTPSARS